MMYSGSRLDDFDGQERRLSREVDTNGNQNSIVQYDPMSSNEKKRNYHRHSHDQIQNLEAYVVDLQLNIYVLIYMHNMILLSYDIEIHDLCVGSSKTVLIQMSSRELIWGKNLTWTVNKLGFGFKIREQK